MLITKRTYKRKYVIGGADIFGSIGNFFARMFSSNAAKQLASAALEARKTAAKDIGMKAIDVSETVAIDAGRKIVEKAAKNYPHQNHKWLMLWFHQKKLLKKVNEVIAKYVDTSAINLNKLIDESSVNRPNASNAIAIQDLVKRLIRSDLQVPYFFFFFY